MLDAMRQDIGFSARLLRKSPAFTLTAVLTLALGIGVNTAVFSVVNALLLRPLPVKDGERLAVLASVHTANPEPHGISYLDLQDFRRITHSFGDLAGYQPSLVGFRSNGRAERITISYVTSNYFTMLGLQPEVGRFIRPDEGIARGADPVIVLSHAFWMRHFNGDRNVAGRGVTVNGRSFTVIGVARPAFTGTYSLISMDAYIPFSMAALDGGTDSVARRDAHSVHALGPLLPGVTLATAAADVAVAARQLAQQYPETNKDVTVRVFSEMLARPEEDGASANPLVATIFLVLVGLVLVVAAVNVTNLSLARAAARQKEMAIRAALGAGRGRLLRQLVTESFVLSAAGGLIGLAIGAFMSRLLAAIRLPGDLPIHFDFHLDGRVLLYGLAATVLTGALIGAMSAMRGTRKEPNEGLREGGRGQGTVRHRLRNALVIAQVAVSLVLLVASGLFVRSMGEAERADLGFRPDGVFNVHMDASQLGYDEARGRALYREVARRVAAIPGVNSLAFAHSTPFGYYNSGGTIEVEGQPTDTADRRRAGWNTVDPAYFQTLGVAIVRGRALTDADDERGRPVAVINQHMAQVLWPGVDPIGRRIRYDGPASPWVEVVGVARDGKYRNVFENPELHFYIPAAQHYVPLRVLHVRTTLAPEALAPLLEREIHALEPNLALFDSGSMTESLGGGNGFFLVRMGATFSAALGFMGLVLAVIGVYGVISYVVSQRTHEIGIRMALGASSSDILRMVLRNGFSLVAIGLGGGLLGALALAPVMGSFLFGITTRDPVTFLGVIGLLGSVALAACLVPAWRAARVNPIVALHDA